MFFGRSCPAALIGAGLLGLGVAGWVDIADNCIVGDCAEDDPFLLSAAWWTSIASVTAGAVAAGVRRRRTA